jgi:hypothetical protein
MAVSPAIMAIETTMVVIFAINFTQALLETFVGSGSPFVNCDRSGEYEPYEEAVKITCENLQSFSLNNIPETRGSCMY